MAIMVRTAGLPIDNPKIFYLRLAKNPVLLGLSITYDPNIQSIVDIPTRSEEIINEFCSVNSIIKSIDTMKQDLNSVIDHMSNKHGEMTTEVTLVKMVYLADTEMEAAGLMDDYIGITVMEGDDLIQIMQDNNCDVLKKMDKIQYIGYYRHTYSMRYVLMAKIR